MTQAAANLKAKGVKRTSRTGTERTELHTHHIDNEAVDKGFILAADYIQHLCKTKVQDQGQDAGLCAAAGTKSC